MKTVQYSLGILAIATSFAFAQGPPQGGQGGPGGRQRPEPSEIFAMLDADSSGGVSLEEFKNGPKAKEDATKAAEIFAEIDADSDGSITLEEFKAHRPPHDAKGGKGGPPQGGE